MGGSAFALFGRITALAMKISIPKLSLVVLIGPSGSGKSTFARKQFLPTEILSSDACRALVGDAATVERVPLYNDKRATKKAASAGFLLHLRPFESTRATGLEPATTGSTVRYSNQLSYAPKRFRDQAVRLTIASINIGVRREPSKIIQGRAGCRADPR